MHLLIYVSFGKMVFSKQLDTAVKNYEDYKKRGLGVLVLYVYIRGVMPHLHVDCSGAIYVPDDSGT